MVFGDAHELELELTLTTLTTSLSSRCGLKNAWIPFFFSFEDFATGDMNEGVGVIIDAVVSPNVKSNVSSNKFSEFD